MPQLPVATPDALGNAFYERHLILVKHLANVCARAPGAGAFSQGHTSRTTAMSMGVWLEMVNCSDPIDRLSESDPYKP